MSTLEKVLTPFELALTTSNSAIKRALLYVCRCQSDSSTFAYGISDHEGIEGMFAGGLIDLCNAKTIPATKSELAILYDMLFEQFGTSDTLQVRVDYNIEHLDFAHVLYRWKELVRLQRLELAASDPLHAKSLPMGCGLPRKSVIRVDSGCATVNASVIDDSGRALRVNPHAAAYTDGNCDLAFHLQPVRPNEWVVKFTNREIAVKLGYTLEDAPMLCRGGNYGVAEHLIRLHTMSKYQEIGIEIFGIVCWGYVKSVEVVKALFEQELTLCPDMGDSLCTLFAELVDYELYTLVETINYNPVGPAISEADRSHLVNMFAAALCRRYSRMNDDPRLFGKILTFWANLQGGAPTEDEADGYKILLCKEILDRARHITARGDVSHVREAVAELEMSSEMENFNTVLIRIDHFESYYSGCTRSQLQHHAAGLLRNLETTYGNLSRPEQKYKWLTYESAKHKLTYI
jgi:hypothetical protein